MFDNMLRSDGTYQESERAVTEAMGDQIAVKA